MNNNQFNTLDILNIMSLMISMQNYGMNLTQNDKQDLLQDLHNSLTENVNDIHQHLLDQDKKIDNLILLLSEIKEKLDKDN